MSKPKVFEKPTGVKDYLPDAVIRLRQIERSTLACMEKWGYRQIITPTLEFYDTVGVSSSTMDSKLFKLLDKRGTTMVLRSELTAPIARVVASLLREEELPIRLAYHANVFRALEDEAGREAEFFQTGVELVGDESPEADAEIVALAVESLKAAGVSNFKIALGHVGFLNGLLQEALPEDEDAQQELKAYLLERNYVGYRNRIRTLPLTDRAKQELEGILRLRGGSDVCEHAVALSQDQTAQRAIAHLCRIWEAIEDYGLKEHVLIDLTMIGDFTYYTGMTFEGYAAELGFPVCSGGRYDNLLQQFGRPAPATGFALKVNRILEIVGNRPLETDRRVLVVYEESRRKEALQTAMELRRKDGVAVETMKASVFVGTEGADRQTADKPASRTDYDEILEFR
ncbi:ATP phosphoribosyltransferase regulatory subunit [Xylanibacillus composti]|uniref:ATP phosphoribosyltransferase regulatory subunit n=1 Tax=Xylanibacillus composti TaxID=1572762 RepID=UPI001BCE0F50|nr:ATP phosphoribosyltransferase regulatory subunit [Xylanibacillus composti]MDT9725070.1 ATP phosphoribosyltransferase regulatory subunit [Xylanibacillus composti]